MTGNITDAVRKRTLDRLLKACVTGEALRFNRGPGFGRCEAISVGGFGELNRLKLVQDAMRRIVELEKVHPLAKDRWLNIWSRVPFQIHVADDALLFAALRKMLPAYRGQGINVYRGQRQAADLGLSWARQPHIALKFAMFGMANVDPVKLALNGKSPSHFKPFADGEFVAAFAPPEAIICDACPIEGEIIVDPRLLVDIERQPAGDAEPWVREHTAVLASCARRWAA